MAGKGRSTYNSVCVREYISRISPVICHVPINRTLIQLPKQMWHGIILSHLDQAAIGLFTATATWLDYCDHPHKAQSVFLLLEMYQTETLNLQ